MKKAFIRLDDACPKRDIEKWDRMEDLLDKYNIIPLVGVIPDCKDPTMDEYEEDPMFWTDRIPRWQKKGWILALHGYQHVFQTTDAGINPVNPRSEFAGLSLAEQKEKIRKGVMILRNNGINPQIFFAPAHTFDLNTLEALKEESEIRFISDTPANDSYYFNGFTVIPQQAGRVRKLPFKTITFCYHPNIMTDEDFDKLDSFMKTNRFSNYEMMKTDRKLSIYDWFLKKAYYWRHQA